MYYETMKEYQDVTINLHAYEIWDMVSFDGRLELDIIDAYITL